MEGVDIVTGEATVVACSTDSALVGAIAEAEIVHQAVVMVVKLNTPAELRVKV